MKLINYIFIVTFKRNLCHICHNHNVCYLYCSQALVKLPNHFLGALEDTMVTMVSGTLDFISFWVTRIIFVSTPPCSFFTSSKIYPLSMVYALTTPLTRGIFGCVVLLKWMVIIPFLGNSNFIFLVCKKSLLLKPIGVFTM